MPAPSYDKKRPHLPAELERAIKVQAGHQCSVTNCGDHSYLDIHHIDENRENNDPTNLILLCTKHHRMAHDGKIDRKSLSLYKARLSEDRYEEILARIVALESRHPETKAEAPVPENLPGQVADAEIVKSAPPRWAVQAFALCHVAITQCEKDLGVYFERTVAFSAGEKRLVLDGLAMNNGAPDIIIDFHYIRKSYLDAPIYASSLSEKLELYEMITGRPAKGILLVAAGRAGMLDEGGLPELRRSSLAEKNVSLQLYSCDQLGFHPGPISASLVNQAFSSP